MTNHPRLAISKLGLSDETPNFRMSRSPFDTLRYPLAGSFLENRKTAVG